MKCPQCAHADTRVIDSRPAEDGAMLRRRRVCDACEYRFTTHERLAYQSLTVVKQDGRREPFNSEKLRAGLFSACTKLPISTAKIEQIASEIERGLRQEPGSEVSSESIGDMVMERLYNTNHVAFVRFASVYQRFEDVESYAQLLERLSRRGRKHETANIVQKTKG